MTFKYIVNFFLRNNSGHYRTVFIVPVIGMFLGSIIIFMTYSIMNSLENQIEHRVNSFKYKYEFCEEVFNNNFNYDNSGVQKIAFIKNENYESVAELYLFNDYNNYKNKIYSFIKEDSHKDGVIIGDDLAHFLDVQIGDSLEIFFPTDINLASSYIPSMLYEVSTIYSFDLFDYDNRYVFLPKKLTQDILAFNELCYFSDAAIDSSSSSEVDLLVEAIKLEKKIYTSLSFMVIFICCIIIFNIMSMVMIDKQRQFFYLNILGISNYSFYGILIVFNSLLSIISTFAGFTICNLILYLNYNFNLFSFVFESLPFKIVPFTGNLFDYFILYLVINILIVSFSTLPYKIVRK